MTVLGRGASALLFVATRASDELPVAIKVLREDPGPDEDTRRRFQREVQILEGLDHPGLPRLRDSGVAGTRPYLVMDRVEGQDLRAARRAGELPPRRALTWLLQLAEALAVIHRAGVVHRDVKPENLLVNAAGDLVVADFGLADGIGLESITGTGQAVGTPLYMAPEQFEGLDADPRMDIYSWGAVAFHLLEGVPPHDAESLADLIRGKACSPEMALETRRVGGRELETLVLECMLWEADDRPTSMEEIATRMRRILRGLDDPPPAAAPPEANLRGWTAAAALLFVPLMLLGYSLVRPGGSTLWIDLRAGYGEVQVRRGEDPLPEGARYRLRRGGRTVAVRPAPPPGEDFRFPVEPTGDARGGLVLELVDGERVLAARGFDGPLPAPRLQLSPEPAGLEVSLDGPAAEDLEVELAAEGGRPRKVTLPTGKTGVRFSWKAPPARYTVSLHVPESGRLLSSLQRP